MHCKTIAPCDGASQSLGDATPDLTTGNNTHRMSAVSTKASTSSIQIPQALTNGDYPDLGKFFERMTELGIFQSRSGGYRTDDANFNTTHPDAKGKATLGG